jgi:predicted branched-subunit amino acid permease
MALISRGLAAASRKGAADMLPLSLAVLPWGILFGSLAVQRGFSWLEAQLFVISSRHFLYGLTLRDRLSSQPLGWRLGLGFLLTDELFALSGHRRAYQSRFRLYYALGAGGSFYLAWNLWTFAGIVAGASLPDLTELGLDFAIAATFIALVVPEIKTLATLVTVLVAAAGGILFSLWQWELGLVCAALLAMLSGYFCAKLQEVSP